MQISLLTVVTMILVIFSASAETSSLRGGSHGTTIDRNNRNLEDVELSYANDNGSEAAVMWKKYDATDCKGAHTRIDGSKYFGGSQNKWQTEYTVKEMLAECKSKCAENEACVAFNFRDNREHPDYTFGGSYCQFWSTITSTPDAVGDSKDCWVSSKSSFGQTLEEKNPTSTPSESPSNKSSDSPSSNGDTIDSLRRTIANLEVSSLATIESLEESMKSLEESIVQKDSIIADLSLQIETIGVPTDLTSQCNAEDGELAFDACQCREQTVIKNTACSKVPVDCVDGFERGTGLTCDKACDGECCAGGTRADGSDSPCGGFTGLVHRDGSCNGEKACFYASIDEVQGPSCTGSNACQNADIDELQGPSCTGSSACRDVKSTLVEASCNGDVVCYRAKVGLIVGGCNGSTLCNGEITDSIVDGKLLREEACNGEFSCRRGYNNKSIIATSIVDGTIYYSPQDPRPICEDDCNAAYRAAGADGVGGVPGSGRTECNDDEFAAYPGWCAYLPCKVECREEFPSSDEDRDPSPDFDKDFFPSSDEGRDPFPDFD